MRAVEASLQSASLPLHQAARLPRAARANHTRIAFSPRAFRPTVSQTEQQAKKRRSNTTVTNTQYRVLVTGSTKGIGRALVDQFLSQGDFVCVTSRTSDAVNAVVEELSRTHADRVVGTVCDVRSPEGVEELAAFAREAMGGVDIWINNAGSNGYSYAPLVDTDPELLKEIVDTNVLGTLLCTRSAISLMAEQEAGGHVFNMEGAGSDGASTQKYAAYGMSKAGMLQLTKSLAEETNGLPVGVHTLSPGLVYTDLVSCGQANGRAWGMRTGWGDFHRDTFGSQGRFFINAIAESPEVVAADVVPRMRELVAKPGARKGNAAVRFLTPDKAIVKLYRRIAKGENANRFFSDADPADSVKSGPRGGRGFHEERKLDAAALKESVKKLAERLVAMFGMIAVWMIPS